MGVDADWVMLTAISSVELLDVMIERTLDEGLVEIVSEDDVWELSWSSMDEDELVEEVGVVNNVLWLVCGSTVSEPAVS